MHSGIPYAFGNIEVYKRGEKVQLTRNFALSEFECKCGKCLYTIICPKLVDKLDLKRERIGQPIKINSAYRCAEHNKAIGGKEYSSHLLGLAADIWYDGYEEGKFIHEFMNEFDGIGVYDHFMHVDLRGHMARWNNKKGVQDGQDN